MEWTVPLFEDRQRIILPNDVRLNQRTKGIQGADWVHRLIPSWEALMAELHQLTRDSVVSEFLNIEYLKHLIAKFEKDPRSEYAFNMEFRTLIRGLIVARFIKSIH